MNLITDALVLILVAKFIDVLIQFDLEQLSQKLNEIFGRFKLGKNALSIKGKEPVSDRTNFKRNVNSLEALTSMDWRYKGVN